jgi:uncharacterized DUF497 family protein
MTNLNEKDMAMTFVWDMKKSIENVVKHGVSFEKAQQAFFDEQRKIFVDEKHSEHEKRYFCFAKVNGEILTVRFTLRGDDIRIIGAGFWRKGRKMYHENEKK